MRCVCVSDIQEVPSVFRSGSWWTPARWNAPARGWGTAWGRMCPRRSPWTPAKLAWPPSRCCFMGQLVRSHVTCIDPPKTHTHTLTHCVCRYTHQQGKYWSTRMITNFIKIPIQILYYSQHFLWTANTFFVDSKEFHCTEKCIFLLTHIS